MAHNMGLHLEIAKNQETRRPNYEVPESHCHQIETI